MALCGRSAVGNDSFRDKTKNIGNHFKTEFDAYKYEMEDVAYLKHKVFTNYVFQRACAGMVF
jgi:hypothetical protein